MFEEGHRDGRITPGARCTPRRKFTVLLALLAIAPRFAATAAPQSAAAPPTVVIVHGGWGGSAYLQPIETRLRSKGFDVYRPSLIGTGETAHLAHADIGLDTHIRQIVNLIEYEDLQNVILTGYSYSGMVVSGVVDRIPERIRLVVYIDAFLPEDGESLSDVANANLARSPGLRKFDEEVKAAPRMAGLIAPWWQKPDRKPPMQDPQPVKPLYEHASLKNPAGRKVRGAFIQFVERGTPPEASNFSNSADRARQRGWPVRILEGDHSTIFRQPALVADAVAELSGAVQARK